MSQKHQKPLISLVYFSFFGGNGENNKFHRPKNGNHSWLSLDDDIESAKSRVDLTSNQVCESDSHAVMDLDIVHRYQAA